MDTIRSISLAITIILFALGIWPVAIVTAIVALTLSEVVNFQKKKQFEELEAKVEHLTKRLDSEQIINRAMNKADSRKKD